jgi:hypothetical protein
MAILPGKCLGPYEILSAIGALPSPGRMGEVYLARERFHPRSPRIMRLDSKVRARNSVSSLDQAPSF